MGTYNIHTTISRGSANSLYGRWECQLSGSEAKHPFLSETPNCSILVAPYRVERLFQGCPFTHYNVLSSVPWMLVAYMFKTRAFNSPSVLWIGGNVGAHNISFTPHLPGTLGLGPTQRNVSGLRAKDGHFGLDSKARITKNMSCIMFLVWAGHPEGHLTGL